MRAFGVLAALSILVSVMIVVALTPTEEGLLFQQDVDEWVDGLQEGKTVYFESPQRKEVVSVARGTRVEKLSDTERRKVRDLLEELILTEKQRMWDNQESAKVMDLAALLAEAKILHRLALQESSLLALEQDDFFLLPDGEGGPPINVDGVTVIDVTSVTVDGERMRLWNALSHERYPSIATAKSYLDELARVNLDDAIARFNAKPLEERMRLFEAHEAWESRRREYEEAQKASEQGVASLFKDPTLYALFAAVGTPALPSHTRADAESYLLYKE